MNSAIIELQKATDESHLTRERRYAHGTDGGSVSLVLSRETRRFRVVWDANDGAGWFGKGWAASFPTEAKAIEFADSKWNALVAWLEKLEPKHVTFSPDFTCA